MLKKRRGPSPAILGKGAPHANKKLQERSFDPYNGWLDTCDLCGYALFECLCLDPNNRKGVDDD